MLVYEPNPCNNYDVPYFDQHPQYHIDQSPPQDLEFERLSKIEIDCLQEDVLSTQIPNPLFYLDTEESDDDIEVTLNKEKFLSDHYIAQVTHPAYTPSIPFLTTMEPADTLLIGDEVISTTPARENDEFIKSSVDDLVPIPRECEVTSDNNLECSMPLDSPPSHRLDVLGERKVDIDLPFGEHLDTLSTRDREIDFNPRDIETNDLIPVPRVFDKPLCNSDSVPKSYDVTFSNPLSDFNDDYTLCYDNPLFDEEFKDISSLDPP
ncbi:hypothetical protein Tco_1510222 [Tanacetum coccineum]